MQSKPTSTSPRATPLKPESSALPGTGVTHLIHRRTGKIARLPREARELLNVMLRDGAPYALISKRMAETGHKISENNLSRWHTGGGHADWLRDQSCLSVHQNSGFVNSWIMHIAHCHIGLMCVVIWHQQLALVEARGSLPARGRKGSQQQSSLAGQ